MSCRFDGSTALERTASVPDYNSNYTQTGWFKADSLAVEQCFWYLMGTDDLNRDQIGLLGSNSHTTMASRIAGTWGSPYEGTIALSADAWTFFVLRRASATELESRIGLVTNQTSVHNNVSLRTQASARMRIGGGSGTAYFTGCLAQVRIWSTNLDDSEIAAEMASSTVVKTGSLWANYVFETSATGLNDSSGNSRTLSYTLGDLSTGEDDPDQGGGGASGFMWLS